MDKNQFFEQYEIHIRDGRLGGGAFGTVYKAYDHINSLWKAIKIAEVKYINGKEFSLISEFNAVKDLPPHRNIANYEAVFQFHMSNGFFDYAVMQYYPEGNLRDLMKGASLSEKQKKDIAEGIIKGVYYLHSNKIIHRDVKPSNILISRKDDQFVPKIADFGLSKFVNNNEFTEITNSFGGGTLEYASPEQLQGFPLRYNSDLWAVGIILYELFMGTTPFASSTNSFSGNEAARRIDIYKSINEAKPPKNISACPFPYNQIIQICLVKDPNDRVQEAKELLEIIQSEKRSLKETTIITTTLASTSKTKADPDITNIISGKEIEQAIEQKIAEKERLNKLKEEKIRKAAENEQERQRKVEEERLQKLEEEQKRKAAEAEKKRLAEEKAKAEKERIEKDRLEKERELIRKREEEKRHQEEQARRMKLAEDKAKAENERLEKERLARIEKERKREEAAQIKKEKERKRAEQIAIEKKEIEKKQAEEKERRRIAAVLRRNKIKQRWTQVKSESKQIFKKSMRPILFLILLFLLYYAGKYTLDQYNEGLILFEKDNLYGYKNSEGEIVVDPIYIKASEFTWGKATASTDSFLFELDKNGKEISKSPIIEKELSSYNGQPKGEVNTSNPPENEDEMRINPRSGSGDEVALGNNSENQVQNPTSPTKNPELDKSTEDPFSADFDDQKSKENQSSQNPGKSPSGLNNPIEEERPLEKSGNVDHNGNPIPKDGTIADDAQASRDKKKNMSEKQEGRPLTPQTTILNPTNRLGVESDEVSFDLPPVVAEIEENLLNVPGGNFKMGCNNNADDCQEDELPAHDVYVGPFYMSKYEVTQKEFEKVMGYNPSYNKCSNCPVETVSWYEAQQYIEKLNALPGSVYKYRLPTEAEWEFAAMGGNSFIYAGSNDIDKVAEYKSTNGVGVIPVTRTKSNGYGLYGMSGNVSEWCQDWYAEDAYQKKGAGAKKEKVIRGGSWYDRQRICRVKNRSSAYPDEQKPTIGFRLVRSLKNK